MSGEMRFDLEWRFDLEGRFDLRQRNLIHGIGRRDGGRTSGIYMGQQSATYSDTMRDLTW